MSVRPPSLLLIVNIATDLRRQKRPLRKQQALKPLARAARAGVVSAELFGQFLVAVYDPHASLDMRFGWVAAAALAHRLKSEVRSRTARRHRFRCAWCT